ncbi:hypothetical protein, partial [Burkholderia pseudomallei]|uniref:hypothetical protein n=1 Tax=Burkholderia pseudomallei TaxID=28450 RepID=UPI001177E047
MSEFTDSAAGRSSTPPADAPSPASRPLRAIQPLPDQLISQIAAGEVVGGAAPPRKGAAGVRAAARRQARDA